MCRLSWNLGASTSWNPQGLSRDCFTFIIRGAKMFAKSCSHLKILGVTWTQFHTEDPQYKLGPRIHAPLPQICPSSACYTKKAGPITECNLSTSFLVILNKKLRLNLSVFETTGSRHATAAPLLYSDDCDTTPYRRWPYSVHCCYVLADTFTADAGLPSPILRAAH